MGTTSKLSVPTIAGRYELGDELARGGNGIVYRVLDQTTGRTLVLKRSLAHDELSHSMLQREYQTLVTLRHPHIIQVYDFGVDEVGPYYTMELLDGVDLRAKCPLPWRELCAYLRDIASSLALLHSRRLIHSDVTIGNIRLTSEGRAKLLDFGALASFGQNSVLSGTPPTISPETLAYGDLDQRADLFALGGTAYYALCERHAYPASSVGLLPAIWASGPPPPPSALVPDIPPELDELVLSLLELEREARPHSAAEVMDRLAVIAGLAPDDEDQRVQHSYLHTTTVGRDAERGLLDEQLRSALSSHGSGALIEGESGLGKSSLLEDVAQTARLSGAYVLTANARAHSGALGAWSALVNQAAKLLRIPAKASTPEAPPEALFLRLQERRPVVLAIEDLHEADHDSVAVYAALAKAIAPHRILLLATLDPGHAGARRPAVQLLRDRLLTIELCPFDERTTLAFVTSLFGEIAGAQRLATFLHNHAAGNPRAYSVVVQHLIEKGFMRYAEGTWALADELPSTGPGGLDLASIVSAAFESRIARWSPATRTLAICMSPQRTRAFDLELCRVLTKEESELRGKDLPQILIDLVREGVLVQDHGAYAFAGSRIRDELYARLSAAQKKRKHALLAGRLFETSGSDPRRAFEIGFHLLLAGEERRACTHINRNVEASLMDHDLIIESVPDLLALLEQQRATGASDKDVQFIEGMLATSGYYFDPTIQDRFGERSFLHIRQTVGVELATRLAPTLGSQLAVSIGVLVAWVKSLFRKPYLVSGSFKVSLLCFAGVAVSVAAGATVRFDRRLHELVFRMLTVARGLGRFNALRLLYDCIELGKDTFDGRYRTLEAALEDQLERLPRVPTITKESQHQWEAAVQYAIGLNQVLQRNSKTLQCADRLDALGAKHDVAMAISLRSLYQLYRGDVASAKREQDRYEQMIALIGSRWVPDVHGALHFLPYHWSRDVLALKRTLQRVGQLLTIAPGVAVHLEVVRAMYEGHRGMPELALNIYDSLADQLAPFAHTLWAAARGHRAECLNILGRPAEALKICDESLTHVTPDDRRYVFVYQQLEREKALALAELGRIDEAVRIVDGLLAECAGLDNPLVIGLLHNDRARVACAARDREAFRTHAQLAEAAFLSTRNPALYARAKQLRALGRNAGLDAARPDDAGFVELIANARATRVLEALVEAVSAESASLYLVFHGTAILSARHGDPAAKSTVVFERKIASVARALTSACSEQDIESALASVQSKAGGTVVFTPLAVPVEGDKQQLVALVVLNDCEDPGGLAQLRLCELAAELRDVDERTDVI